MGKGSRNREIRIADNQNTANGGVKLSKKQLIKQQEKKAKMKKMITMATAVVLLVAVVVSIVVVALNKAPKLEGNVSATSGSIELDNAMIAYFMYGNYHNFVNENIYYLSYYGLDTTKSLKSQKVIGSDQTWFSYFLNQTKAQINELVAVASEAMAKGVTLDDEEKKEIDDAIKDLRDYAKSQGYTSVNKYLAATYVTGVTENAVRKCFELQSLASKYYQELYESFEYTEEEYQDYVKKNPGYFYKFDYVFYDFDPESKTNATEAEKKAALEAAKKKAEEFLAKVTDETTFKNLIVELEKEAEANKTKPTTTTGTSTGTGTDNEKTDEDYLKKFIVEGEYYDEDSDFGKWAFAEGRKDGDFAIVDVTKTYTDKDGKETVEVVGYTVYYLTKAAYKDEYNAKDVRHILFTKSKYGTDDAAKAKAEEILAAFKAGDMTPEAFGELAKEHTEDGNGDKGGLYEDVLKDQMVAEFNDWLFDEKRKEGDVEIVKTSYGYHIMYDGGEGREAWRVVAENYLKADEYKELLEELEKTYPVTYDNAKLATIP